MKVESPEAIKPSCKKMDDKLSSVLLQVPIVQGGKWAGEAVVARHICSIGSVKFFVFLGVIITSLLLWSLGFHGLLVMFSWLSWSHCFYCLVAFMVSWLSWSHAFLLLLFSNGAYGLLCMLVVCYLSRIVFASVQLLLAIVDLA